jgi:hypothetical protein
MTWTTDSYDNPIIQQDPGAYAPSSTLERADPMSTLDNITRAASSLLPDQAGSRVMSPDEQHKQFGSLIDTSQPQTEQAAWDQYNAAKSESQRNDAMARSPSRTLGVRATDLAAGFLDPVGLATGLVPGVGEETIASRLLGDAAGSAVRQGGIRALDGVGQRFVTRAASGGTAGLGAGLLQSDVSHAAANANDQEYSVGDTLRDIAMGGVMGGSMHALGGAALDMVKSGLGIARPDVAFPGNAPPALKTNPADITPHEDTLMSSLDAREAAVQTAMAQASTYRPVDVSDLLDAHTAEQAGFDVDRFEQLQSARQAQAEQDMGGDADAAMQQQAATQAATQAQVSALAGDLAPAAAAHDAATAALEAPSSPVADQPASPAATAMAARIGELQGHIAGIQADLDKYGGPSGPDDNTPARIEAIDAELGGAVSAARRAQLEGERSILTDPEYDVQAGRDAQARQGLQTALERGTSDLEKTQKALEKQKAKDDYQANRAQVDNGYRIKAVAAQGKKAAAIRLAAKTLRTYAYKASGQAMDTDLSEELAQAVLSKRMSLEDATELLRGKEDTSPATATADMAQPAPEPEMARNPVSGEMEPVTPEPAAEPEPAESTQSRLVSLKGISEKAARMREILKLYSDHLGGVSTDDEISQHADDILSGQVHQADILRNMRDLGTESGLPTQIDAAHWQQVLGDEAWKAVARAKDVSLRGDMPDADSQALQQQLTRAGKVSATDIGGDDLKSLQAFEQAVKDAGGDTGEPVEANKWLQRAQAVAEAMACMLGG